MPNFHPLLVHLPIALLTASLLFDVLCLVTRKHDFERTAWWCLLVGTVGLAATVASGLFAERTVSIAEQAREHFETHQQVAFIIAGIYAGLFLWRIANRTKLPEQRGWFYVGLSLLGVILLWVGAWYGGELVFRFGVGVQSH